jgi:iron complex transport system ATP-binding protein
VTAVLEAIDLSVGYRSGRRRTTTVLPHVSAALHAGELACLLGPNGAGKSTLLRTLIGGQPVLGGSVRLAGTDIGAMSPRSRARHLSVVLTDRIEVGLLTARTLVELGRAPRIGWFAALGVADHDVVDWALDATGASALAARQVHELSDGERQRVMIARALAQEPDVLVLDEPTAFLDLTRRVELIAVLRRLTATTGLAVLMSTHELELALRTADAVWLVHPDGGFRTGAPEDLAIGGHVADAYAGGGIAFDHGTGTFVVTTATATRSAVVVGGSQPHSTWAARAVQRAGWSVVDRDDLSSGRLDVRGDDDETTRWQLSLDARPSASGTSLESLVHHLRAVDPSAVSAPSHPPTHLETHT